jgi:hypothetical protein
MRLTTPDNLPVPEAGDDVDPLEDWLGDLADAVQKALRRDTDWKAVPITASSVVSDSSEPAQYRVLNGVVYLRGVLVAKSGNLPSGNYVTLPTEYAPVGTRFVALLYQGVATACRFIANTNGTLNFNHNGISTTSVRLDGAFWPLPA